jgi:hypothetical protein
MSFPIQMPRTQADNTWREAAQVDSVDISENPCRLHLLNTTLYELKKQEAVLCMEKLHSLMSKADKQIATIQHGSP